MSGCLDYNVFAALLDGSLPAGERRAATGHIGRCTSCREMAMDLGYEVPADPALAATEVAGSLLGSNVTAAGSGEVPSIAHRTDASSEVVDIDPSFQRNSDGWIERRDLRIPERGETQPLVGRVIAGYRVKREIGRGGMGAVYEAVHERMGQRAAVKVMFSLFSRDPQFIRRFHAEARAASAVRHPGLVTIFNHGQLPDGTAYIMMEYLSGESLRRRIEARRLTLPEILRIARQLASALCAVHKHGIVHRDLKPDNVMNVPDADLPGGERVKVVDFGIAKVETEVPTNPTGSSLVSGRRAFIGTVAYASPEQCRTSSSIDGKSDVYSLGIMLYEMLTGDLPFTGAMSEVLDKHATVEPRPLRELRKDVPVPLAALVHEMLAKSPQARPSMSAIRDRIDQLLAPRRLTTARWPALFAASLLALVCFAAVVLRVLGRI